MISAQIFSLVVLRSIPSAASTFAAFEITRGMAIHPSLASAELTQEPLEYLKDWTGV